MLSLLLWQRSDLQPLVIAVGAIAMGALLWLYPTQLGRLNRRWRWILPVLRATVIVALAISILKPVAARPKSTSERGAVVFLVDQSRSMQIKDTGRTPAEAMALAQGLGLLPPGRHTFEAANLEPAPAECTSAPGSRLSRSKRGRVCTACWTRHRTGTATAQRSYCRTARKRRKSRRKGEPAQTITGPVATSGRIETPAAGI